MKTKYILALFTAAAMLAGAAAAKAESRWNSPPFVSTPPLVSETPAELRQRVEEISTFPTELDPRLWRNAKLRPEVRQRVLDVVGQMFDALKLDNVSIKAVEVRGSNVSYEYDDSADFGVRVFLETSAYQGNIEDLAARVKSYNAFIETQHEGQVLIHGVPLEVNFYVIRTARLDPVKGVGHYSISDDRWMEPPVVQESTFDRARMLTDIEGFTSRYNALVMEYFANKRSFNCNRWSGFSKALGGYRNAGIEASGTRSTENLVYRLLRRLSVNVVDETSALGLECQNIHWSLEEGE